MNKKIIYKLITLILFGFILKFPINVNASSNAKVYFVFDKTSYNKADIINLNINLDQFTNLNEIKFQIKVNTEYLEPIINDNTYFQFSNSSICNNDILNDYTNESILRLHLLNNNVSNGYYSNYKNNVCNISFKARKAIDNIYKYFSKDNFNLYGISLYLFDINDNLINYECNYLEKINIIWDKESYILNVYDEIPNFKDDIIINNRDINEYEYLIEKTIDTSTIGLKTIHIAIYDRLTADYIILSKAINIIDEIPPIITVEPSFTVKDINIKDLNFYEYINAKDNYDINLKINILYFNDNFTELKTIDEFKKYLSNNEIGYIKYIVEDSSNNISQTEYIEINMIDTTSPNINKLENIEISDVNIDALNLENYFVISDNYDKNPKVVIIYFEYNDKTFFEIKELLKNGNKIVFTYYGIDKKGNKTQEFTSEIIPIDTTKPTIKSNDIEINDTEYSQLDLTSYVSISDNFNNEITLITKYFIEDIEVLKEEFDQKILKGIRGYVKYVAYDCFNNYSDEAIQNVTIIDTIKPIIVIKNIKDKEKYISIEKVEYEITDNFEGCSIKVLLDDNVYNGERIELGSHTLYIEAVDLAGNKEEVLLNFEVIEDNIIGCGDDFSCYINNYIEIVIIVGVLLLFVVGLIIAHLIIKNKKEEIM